jgi:hypothetical protein
MLFLVIKRLITIHIIQNHNLKSLYASTENNIKILRYIIIVRYLYYFRLKLLYELYSIFKYMIKKTAIIILIPFLLFACSTLKPVEKMTDKELVDKYYKMDLQLYMARRAGNSRTANPGPSNEYVGKENNKTSKLERKLKIMRQELIRRGYIP